MSLKAVHICFILLSMVLAFGFGYWAVRGSYFYLGIGSWVGGVGLVAYLFWFLHKIKRLNSW